MPKINFASSMIVEDHLKKVLAKTEGKPWKFTNNKLLPRSQHSPFGDFPPEYMKKASNAVEPVPLIDSAELSLAATGKRKSSHSNSNALFQTIMRVICEFSIF